MEKGRRRVKAYGNMKNKKSGSPSPRRRRRPLASTAPSPLQTPDPYVVPQGGLGERPSRAVRVTPLPHLPLPSPGEAHAAPALAGPSGFWCGILA